MAISDLLTQELDQEAQTTRRVLERVPDDKLAWKPHDKSMSLGQLCSPRGDRAGQCRPDGNAVVSPDPRLHTTGRRHGS